MEQIKIQNFERRHGKGTFVHFRHLADVEAFHLRKTVESMLGLPVDAPPAELVKVVRDAGILVKGVNAESRNFDLQSIVKGLGLVVSHITYLNWYRYDDIDELRTVDLFQWFGDLWYPSSDDLDLIDSELRWLISVRHDGNIQFLKLHGQSG